MSVIIPTVGRETLRDAIASASWADEVIVVFDAASVPADAPQGVEVFACGPSGNWGAEQRSWASPGRQGTHLAFIDDDDVFTPGERHRLAGARCTPGTGSHLQDAEGGPMYGGHGCISREGSGRRCS